MKLFQYIKEFMVNNCKKIITALMYFSCAMVFIAWATDFYMEEFAAKLLIFVTLVFYIFGGGFLRSAYLLFLGLTVMFENHLVINYSYPFSRIGKEILVLASETTSLEFSTYLNLITQQEYLNFIYLMAVCIFVWRFSPKQRSNTFPILVGSLLLVTAMWNDLGAPVYAYRQEMSESAAILARYKNFEFNAKDVSDEEYSTYILVIGETHRHDFLEEYAYSQEYGSHLLNARDNGLLYVFSDTTSGFYYTTASVPVILTRKPIDYDNRFYEEKSLVSAFKEAGYATYTLSYTKKTQPEDDAMNMIFLEADKYINHVDTSETFDDVGMLPFIKDILADKTVKKKLLVIKMIGAHYLYEDRYTKEYDIHQPSFKTVHDSGEAANNPILLKNSYKNAIIYSMNFVDQLYALVEQQKEPILMTFISDHGTVLFDDDKSKYIGRAKGAYHVGFFIAGNEPFWQNTDRNIKYNLRKHKNESITQEYFFETYLSLAKIKYFEHRPKYDLTSDDFEPTIKRIVWTGSGIENYDDLAPEKPIKEEK